MIVSLNESRKYYSQIQILIKNNVIQCITHKYKSQLTVYTKSCGTLLSSAI